MGFKHFAITLVFLLGLSILVCSHLVTAAPVSLPSQPRVVAAALRYFEKQVLETRAVPGQICGGRAFGHRVTIQFKVTVPSNDPSGHKDLFVAKSYGVHEGIWGEAEVVCEE